MHSPQSQISNIIILPELEQSNMYKKKLERKITNILNKLKEGEFTLSGSKTYHKAEYLKQFTNFGILNISNFKLL